MSEANHQGWGYKTSLPDEVLQELLAAATAQKMTKKKAFAALLMPRRGQVDQRGIEDDLLALVTAGMGRRREFDEDDYFMFSTHIPAELREAIRRVSAENELKVKAVGRLALMGCAGRIAELLGENS